MLNKYLDKLERKFGKFAISGLMMFIVVGMGAVYIFDLVLSMKPDNTIFISSLLTFNKSLILQGQVWRAISFLLIPPYEGNIIFVVFELQNFEFHLLIRVNITSNFQTEINIYRFFLKNPNNNPFSSNSSSKEQYPIESLAKDNLI